MIAVVTGGASSGKSAFAEQLALSCEGPHAYVATMRHGDAETEARIDRHRAQREGKGFITYEIDAASPSVDLAPCATALLEDLGNLVVNGLESALPDVLACENVVVVANEVGSDGVSYDEYTSDYIIKLGGLARDLAIQADVVVEVVAGIPHVVKGELP